VECPAGLARPEEFVSEEATAGAPEAGFPRF
jgi:hypothetical protein